MVHVIYFVEPENCEMYYHGLKNSMSVPSKLSSIHLSNSLTSSGLFSKCCLKSPTWPFLYHFLAHSFAASVSVSSRLGQHRYLLFIFIECQKDICIFGAMPYLKSPLLPVSCCLSWFELSALYAGCCLEDIRGISPSLTSICQSRAAFPHTTQI